MIVSAILPYTYAGGGEANQQALWQLQLLTEMRNGIVTLWWSSPTADRPVDPVLGQIIYDTTTLQMMYCSAIRDHATPAVWTAFTTGGAGTGTVTSIGADDPIIVTPDPITVAGVVSHANSGVTAGTYGDATNVAQVTVDAKGHVTDVTEVPISGGGGGGAPVDAEYVVMSLNATLTQERVLTEGFGIEITDNGANNTVVVATDFSGMAFTWWGSGQDGVVHFNGTNTFSFATKTGSVYVLLRAVHATDCTIDVGVSVTTFDWTTTNVGGGQQIYCTGTFTNNGHYHNNGTTNTINQNIGGLGGTSQGGVTNLYGIGSNGGNSANPGLNGSSLVTFGGRGGNGGAGAASAGGLGGTITVPDAAQCGGVNFLYAPQVMYAGRIPQEANPQQQRIFGGTGGGGGGGSPSSGGGGAGGGGPLGLIARYCAGSGIVSCDGGVGSPGDWTSPGVTQGGGGGGGGGGVLLILTTTTNIASILTLRANGGAGGTAIGAGVAGAAGAAGRVIVTIVTA